MGMEKLDLNDKLTPISTWTSGFQITTISMPDFYFKIIQTLIDKGIFPNRSECCRKVLWRYLKKLKVERAQVNKLDYLIEQYLK